MSTPKIVELDADIDASIREYIKTPFEEDEKEGTFAGKGAYGEVHIIVVIYGRK
jgi:hypothetical protein